MAGEKAFLEQCDVIWTNSRWTAETFEWTGIDPGKFWVHAPACNCEDPGPLERDWSTPHVLFIGKDWSRKGGEVLVEAFAELKRRIPRARLTIMGCSPEIDQDGVDVLGFLDKGKEDEKRIIERVLREATLFCMPSRWESTGLVYMEAALHGMPLVMLRGQGREEIFPEQMAIHLDSTDSAPLAATLLELAEDPERMRRMGEYGAAHVRANYTQQVVASRLVDRLKQVEPKGYVRS